MTFAGEKQETCTVRLSGGLGNQMFQYAAGRALSLRTHSNLLIETSFYQRNRKRHRDLELVHFPIAGKIVRNKPSFPLASQLKSILLRQSRLQNAYREPHFHFDEDFQRLQAPVSIEGYFQSERYFDAYATTIRNELVIPQPTDPSVLRTGQQIADSSATSLHIRRGDYISNKKANNVYSQCPLQYFHHAMEQIRGSAPVYVFSDDIAWAKHNLRDVKPLVFPSEKSPQSALDDLWLMSQASNHIIANSTFSWWGAWLAGISKGVTIAPAKWFNNPNLVDVDLIPQRWLRI